MHKLVFLFFASIMSLSAQSQVPIGDIDFKRLDGFKKPDARKEIKIPNILGYTTLKADFHIHTIFSDGAVLPTERVNEAWREGLDVIAITDHSTSQPKYLVADYNTSYKLAKPLAAKRGITLIQATEYTKSEPIGHMNVLFTKDANYYAQKNITPSEALEHANKEGAFVILNHPGWPDMNSVLDTFHLNQIKKFNIKGIEVINSDEYYPRVMDYCNELNLAPLSNSDIHPPIHSLFDVEHTHRNFTIVFAKENTEAGIKEALLEGRTVAFASNLLVGKPVFIKALIKESLLVSKLKMDAFEFSCDVTNQSDITYLLKGPSHKRYTFPAGSTIQLNGAIADAEMVYALENAFITSKDNLEIPLINLLSPKEEVMMPFIRENITHIDRGTNISIENNTNGALLKYTLDGGEPTINDLTYSAPLSLNKSTILKVKAFAPGLVPSRTLKRQVLFNYFHEAEKINLNTNGLNYEYYEGSVSTVLEIASKAKLLKAGMVNFPDLSVAHVEDSFAIIYKGYLYIPVTGEYKFSLEADDGAVMKIAGVELLDNDGSHSLKKVKGYIQLTKGFHPIELHYFDDYDEQELRLKWTVPGGQETLIPTAAYFLRK